MGSILNILGKPLGSVLEGVGGIIDKFVTTDKERLEAKAAVLKMTTDFQLELAKVDAQFAAEQAKVLVAEAQSESWLTRNWRPLLMLVFTFIIAYNFVLGPMLSLETLPIPPDMWELLKIGIGGYIVGRSAENVASWVPDMLNAKNGKK